MIHWELSISVADKVATTQNNFCWDGIIIGKKKTLRQTLKKLGSWDPKSRGTFHKIPEVRNI